MSKLQSSKFTKFSNEKGKCNIFTDSLFLRTKECDLLKSINHSMIMLPTLKIDMMLHFCTVYVNILEGVPGVHSVMRLSTKSSTLEECIVGYGLSL